MNLLDRNNRVETIAFGAMAIVLLFVMPGLNMLPKDSALHLSTFQLSSVWGKYLCFAVLAMSLNLLWGYTGLLCLGQNLFFALGAYAFGMHLMLEIGPDPIYKSALPDFMDFLGYQVLPVHWRPFENFAFAAFAVLWVPGLVALIFGFLAFRSRIKGVYFAILTQALTYAASLLFFRADFTFGGNNGFTDFKTVLGADLRDPTTLRWIFIATVVLLLSTYALMSGLLRSKFGKVQQAVRDSENRVRFSGYSTTSFKLFVFTLSAVIAGMAGALYVPQVGIINPSEMEVGRGLDIVVWVAVGGRGTRFGPIIGAIAVNLLKSYTTRAYPDSWVLIAGGLFVFVVLLMPNGLMGLPTQLKDGYKRSLSRWNSWSGREPGESTN